MAWTFTICDVFTKRPLAGNQLAVFTNAADIPDALLQPIAREIAFAETVFLYPAATGADARMRIFTPNAELRFAGHPIIGAAVVLGAERGGDEIKLETGAGTVPVTLSRKNGRVIAGRMRQPVPTSSPWRNPESLLLALGTTKSTLPVTIYDNGMVHVYIGFESRDAVRALHPDPYDLATIARERGMPTIGIVCFAGTGTEWKSRMFSPAAGVAEDAATGSAAGPLACHLFQHGLIESGVDIEIRQGREIGRPSVLHTTVFGYPDRIERVEVSGGAQIVGRGEFDEDVLRQLL
ncbi:MAG: PhzF family phenazine biosynthesis protein [Thermomicrobiales bacterium]